MACRAPYCAGRMTTISTCRWAMAPHTRSPPDEPENPNPNRPDHQHQGVDRTLEAMKTRPKPSADSQWAMIRRIACVLLDWRLICVCARKCTFVSTSDRGGCDGHSLCAYTSAGSSYRPPEKSPVDDTGFTPGGRRSQPLEPSLWEPDWKEFSGC